MPYAGGEVTAKRYKQNTLDHDGYKIDGYALQVEVPIIHYSHYKGYQQAKKNVERLTLSREDTAMQLAYDVATAYFQVLLAQQDLEVAQAENLAVTRLLERAQAEFKVGRIIVTDLEEARARVDLSNAQLLALAETRESRQEALVELIGKQVASLADLEQSFPLDKPEQDVAYWIQKALVRNPMFRVLDVAAEAAQLGADKARGGLYPTLSLNASHSVYNNTASATWLGADTNTQVLGVTLSVPLFQGGRPEAQMREALSQKDEAQLKREDLYRKITRQVGDSYRGVLTAIARVNALKQAEKSAQTALKTTQAGFTAGVRTMLDILNAERALRDTQRHLNAARIGYVLNTLALHRAAGELNGELMQRINSWLQKGV
ncbi:outer membrane efflux protein [Magnetococcus marinus MC-1]|uniref:Outer membrane efflux protein n=1 Tax=Magnetococcus marinus (strain ATCC BAA-1437 / JCM 17883 / MC-1) TaxID=156889 RepID=A0L6A4_MAGMM|nr:TolC family protein [Magnetococcus marinus]ABK43497.1 outer membrane efflux protein [Magnetococcus marinus MC-1]